jgi:glycosyltransferase involved in cell wall biosynthesis
VSGGATVRAVRVLVISNLYPPVVRGGYEVECSGVVERLRERHEVLVLTGDHEREQAPAQDGVWRELPWLADTWRGAVRAPAAARRAAELARRALAWQPDLVYAWNNSGVSQVTLRMLADNGAPVAFRVCSHGVGEIFVADQFMRELLPRRRRPLRATWSAGCKALNRLPSLRLEPTTPLRVAVSWNSEFIRRAVELPSFVEPVFERIGHSVPRYGDLYAAVERDPAREPEIAFLGRVTPFKGLSVAIEALALLRSEHGISARLVVIGPEDPEHGAEMRRLSEHLGVSSAVSWQGQLTAEQAAAALARAHALIVPSMWLEPFPLVTIEGALAHVPLVAADIGGIGEGMHDEEHALLFAPGDAGAAAAALMRTLSEREQTQARVARANERAQEFRLGPYLDDQEQFVIDAAAALGASVGETVRPASTG